MRANSHVSQRVPRSTKSEVNNPEYAGRTINTWMYSLYARAFASWRRSRVVGLKPDVYPSMRIYSCILYVRFFSGVRHSRCRQGEDLDGDGKGGLGRTRNANGLRWHIWRSTRVSGRSGA